MTEPTGPDPSADPRPEDEAALRQLFAHLADDPDAPPSRVNALSVRAAVGRRRDARRARARTGLLVAAGLAAVALLVPVVLRASGGSETQTASSADLQFSGAGSPAAAPGDGPSNAPDAAPPGDPSGTSATRAASTGSSAVSGAQGAAGGATSPAAASPAATSLAPTTSAGGAAAGSVSTAGPRAGAPAPGADAAGGSATCAVPSLDAAAVAAVVDALDGRGGVLQEIAPAVLPCAREGSAGTLFDVVAGERAGSLQVSVLGAAPAECAAGCPAVAGTAGLLLGADGPGSAVAVPGVQRWVVLEQDVTNVSGLPQLPAMPFTAADLAAAGEAVLAAG